MKTKNLFLILMSVSLLGCFSCSAARNPKFDGVEGLLLAGYQGWFNAEGDGAGLGWKHYEKNHEFEPGKCTIDLWPDVSEYEKLYPSPFKFADGTTAELFSSHDRSTTMLHFKWMNDYGIDGVFMQRFGASLRTPEGKSNYNHILFNALDASEQYGRAICVMYDLSGLRADEVANIESDWRELSKKHKITERETYLHHNGKPLVAVWGAGFNDNRKYGYKEIKHLLEFLKAQGCSVLLGVPTHWRDLTMDTIDDPELHALIDNYVDIVHPWFVGRFNNESYDGFNTLIAGDLEWCKAHGKTYMPVIFPGFSWYNLKDGVAAPMNSIPRLGGAFLWKQAYTAASLGAKTLYVAMFDEIDEGTAIFKCANTVPVGQSPFLTYEGCEPDRYLWLAGMAARALKGEFEMTPQMPGRE